MKRWLCLAGLLATIGIALSGCGGHGVDTAEQAPEAEPVPILVWTWEAAGHRGMFEAFMADYPEYILEPVAVESLDMLQKLQTTMASGGQMPDLTSLDQKQRGVFLEMEIWEDISGPPYYFDTSQVLDYLLPGETTPSGAYVGPDFPGLGAMCYKRALALEYFGTDDTEALEALLPDWDAFIRLGKDVRERSGGQVYMMPSLHSYSMIYKGQSNMPYFIGDTLNLREALQPAFDTMLEMKRAGIVDSLQPNSPEEGASYAEDRHIFYWLPNWSVNSIIKFNDPDGQGRWGFMLPPGGPFTGDGACYAVPKSARNKEGAVAYIKYICQTIRGSELLRDFPGSFSPFKPTYDIDGFYSNPEPWFGGQDVLGLFAQRVLPNLRAPRTPTRYDADFDNAYTLARKALTVSDGSSLTSLELIVNMEKELMERNPELILPAEQD